MFGVVEGKMKVVAFQDRAFDQSRGSCTYPSVA